MMAMALVTVTAPVTTMVMEPRPSNYIDHQMVPIPAYPGNNNGDNNSHHTTTSVSMMADAFPKPTPSMSPEDNDVPHVPSAPVSHGDNDNDPNTSVAPTTTIADDNPG